MKVIPFLGKFGQSFNVDRISSNFSLSESVVMMKIYQSKIIITAKCEKKTLDFIDTNQVIKYIEISYHRHSVHSFDKNKKYDNNE